MIVNTELTFRWVASLPLLEGFGDLECPIFGVFNDYTYTQ